MPEVTLPTFFQRLVPEAKLSGKIGILILHIK